MNVDSAREIIPPVVLTGDETEAYHELQSNAVWFESEGRWSSFRGDKAVDALNGLVTNDVSTLANGEGLHAAILSPKGKMITEALIMRFSHDEFALTVSRPTAQAWLDLARKYVNPRLCKVSDDSDRYRAWMVYGARAAQVIASLGGGDATAENLSDGMASVLAEWPTWHHAPWNLGRVSVRLIRAPLLGSRPGFMLMAETKDAELVQQRLEAAPMVKGSRNLWNVARIEAGRPAMGLDMDENTIPQEANLDTLGAISFSKGCYTGQETVARVHFRGHVNRRLRGLLANEPIAQGSELTDSAGKVVGDARSSAVSPALGPIAMVMLRREVADGDTVTVLGERGPISARVIELPFPAA